MFNLYKRNKDNLTFERLVATNPDGYEIRKNYQKSIDIVIERCYNKYIGEESKLLNEQKAVLWRRGHDTNRSGFQSTSRVRTTKIEKFKKGIDIAIKRCYNKYIR